MDEPLSALPAEPSSPRAARQLVRAVCRDWQVDDDLCNDAAFVANELVANVVDHAHTECVSSTTCADSRLQRGVTELGDGKAVWRS
jgi:anti-sigma regulatory factor (Ser/Thr protein kinase)